MKELLQEIINSKSKFFGFLLVFCLIVISVGVFTIKGNRAEVFITLFKKYAETILGAAIAALGMAIGQTK